MEPTHDVPPGGTPLSTSFRPSAMRPVVPMRKDEPVKKDNPANPFAMIQAANRGSEDLVTRLQNLVEKLAGDTPTFEPGKEPSEDTGGLLPLAARVANLITERSRHGVTLVDKIEEYLG
jgi:hypothetical protein